MLKRFMSVICQQSNDLWFIHTKILVIVRGFEFVPYRHLEEPIANRIWSTAGHQVATEPQVFS